MVDWNKARAQFLSSLGGMPSIPIALETSSYSRAFSTSSWDNGSWLLSEWCSTELRSSVKRVMLCMFTVPHDFWKPQLHIPPNMAATDHCH